MEKGRGGGGRADIPQNTFKKCFNYLFETMQTKGARTLNKCHKSAKKKTIGGNIEQIKKRLEKKLRKICFDKCSCFRQGIPETSTVASQLGLKAAKGFELFGGVSGLVECLVRASLRKIWICLDGLNKKLHCSLSLPRASCC